MQQLCLQIEALNINDTDKEKFVVKFADPKTTQTIKQYIKLECNGKWTVDIDDSIIKMLINGLKLQIFDTVSNKDGSINETLLGITNIDLTPFLYGETEISSTNIIESADDKTDNKNDIGTIKLSVTVNNSIFTDKQIDFNNFLNVEINKMKNISKVWIDHLSSNQADTGKDKKKSKGKQEPAPKHWLECDLKVFEKDIPSLKINISQNETPKLIPSEKQNDENDENDMNDKYYLDWNFKSKYLLRECDMNLLINKFKNNMNEMTDSMIKISHKYEEINDNQEVVIMTDPNCLSGHINIQSLFNNSESIQSIQSIQLAFDEKDDNATATTIEIKLCFDKSFQEYRHELDNKLNFKDIFCPQNSDENKINDLNDNSLCTQQCVNDIIQILVEEYGKFTEKTSIQKYDNERMNHGFIYHLNSTGLYHELKEKLVKPEILKYIDKMANDEVKHPLNGIFQNVLGDMITNLSNNVCNDIKTISTSLIKDETNNVQISIKKHSEIANDFEKQEMISNAYNHYQMAFDLNKNDWNSLQNLIKILIKQNKTNEAISILTEFVSNRSDDIQCLLFLTAVLIENKHENAKCVMYEFCDQCDKQLNITCLILKGIFFSMNNDEIRSDINFKKAIKISNNDSNQLQQPFDILFELRCFEMISVILNNFQKFEQIDINFHINNAKMDAEMQRFGTAYASINEAIKINDELAELWSIKGHIEYKSDKMDAAMTSYIKYLQLCPGTVESLLPKSEELILDKLALYRLGKMYENKHEYKLSLQTYFQGIEYQDSESWIFWYEAGNSLFELKDYSQCIHCFEQSNLMNNNEPHSWCILAICYLAINEPKKAIKIMKEALKFGIDNISNTDKQRMKEFGENLMNIGHIESGKLFINCIVSYI